MQGFIDETADFVLDSLFDGKPVEIFPGIRDVIRFLHAFDHADGIVLGALEWIEGRSWKACKE